MFGVYTNMFVTPFGSSRTCSYEFAAIRTIVNHSLSITRPACTSTCPTRNRYRPALENPPHPSLRRMSSPPTTATFYHSTPMQSTQHLNRFGSRPFAGEQFHCDVHAWLDMEQLSNEISKLSDASHVDPESFWIVETGATPAAADVDLRAANNAPVPVRSRFVMQLTELAERLMAGGKGGVVRGQRIITTDQRLTTFPRTERAFVATERTIRNVVKRAAAKDATLQRQTKEAAEDLECDPDDDLCTCRKCRKDLEG